MSSRRYSTRPFTSPSSVSSPLSSHTPPVTHSRTRTRPARSSRVASSDPESNLPSGIPRHFVCSQAFISSIKVGDLVDVFDAADGAMNWTRGRIKNIYPDGFWIHYEGWDPAYDTIVPISQARYRLAPLNSFTKDESDGHHSSCSYCHQGGEMVLCDGCPRVYHHTCIQNVKPPNLIDPDVPWWCEACIKKGKNQENYERTKSNEGTEQANEGRTRAQGQTRGRKRNKRKESNSSQQDADTRPAPLRKIDNNQTRISPSKSFHQEESKEFLSQSKRSKRSIERAKNNTIQEDFDPNPLQPSINSRRKVYPPIVLSPATTRQQASHVAPSSSHSSPVHSAAKSPLPPPPPSKFVECFHYFLNHPTAANFDSSPPFTTSLTNLPPFSFPSEFFSPGLPLSILTEFFEELDKDFDKPKLPLNAIETMNREQLVNNKVSKQSQSQLSSNSSSLTPSSTQAALGIRDSLFAMKSFLQNKIDEKLEEFSRDPSLSAFPFVSQRSWSQPSVSSPPLSQSRIRSDQKLERKELDETLQFILSQQTVREERIRQLQGELAQLHEQEQEVYKRQAEMDQEWKVKEQEIENQVEKQRIIQIMQKQASQRLEALKQHLMSQDEQGIPVWQPLATIEKRLRLTNVGSSGVTEESERKATQLIESILTEDGDSKDIELSFQVESEDAQRS
jgi:hypothetical protein